MTRLSRNIFMVTAIGAACVCFAAKGYAGVGKISSPQVDKGSKEIESTGTYAFQYDGQSEEEFENEFELEYGLTDELLLEAEFEIEKESSEETEIGGFGFGVRYELSEPGEWLIDTAVSAGYEFSGSGGADEVGVGVLLQKYVGDIKVLSNIDVEYEVGEKSENGVGLEAAFGGYKDFGSFYMGVEYFADFGNLSEQSGYSAQEHAVGPIIGSEVHLPGGREIEYSIGYYQGVSDAAADGTIKYELEFEF